jgi:peroxiredoxin
LDRLVNEILVLSAASDTPAATSEEVEARIAALARSWDVSEEELGSALAEVDLTRSDLTARTARLIQVELALDELAAGEVDLNGWLARTRIEAEIGLYRSLVPEIFAAPAEAEAALPEPSPDPTVESEADLKELEAPAESEDEPAAETSVEAYAPPPGVAEAPYPDNFAPDFSLARLDGDSLTLSDFRGKPVLINFWASWCPPCRRELPALEAAYAAYGNDIGFIAVDVKEAPETVAAFVEEIGLTFPVALDQDGRVSSRLYEIRGTPTTVFVDANGVVAARHVGPLDEAMIDSYLAPLLAPVVKEVKPQLDPDLPPAPEFSLTAASGETFSLPDYRDKSNVVLVFYRGQT